MTWNRTADKTQSAVSVGTSAFEAAAAALLYGDSDVTGITDNDTGNSTHGPLTIAPRYSLAEQIVVGTILSLIVFFSIAGNILVVVAVLTDRNLRKISNYFIVSLAFADLFVACLVMIFAVANDILGYWVFGVPFCSVWTSLDVMCSTSSIMNLCGISLDRWIHIKNPLHYETWMTKRKALGGVFLVWTMSALISFLPIQLGWHRHQSYQPAQQYRADGRYICLLELNPIYAVTSSVVSFYAPCVVMIMIYIKLYQYARRQVKSIRKTWSVAPDGAGGGAGASGYKASDHKAAITLGVIMGTFLLCWLPFFTINIIRPVEFESDNS